MKFDLLVHPHNGKMIPNDMKIINMLVTSLCSKFLLVEAVLRDTLVMQLITTPNGNWHSRVSRPAYIFNGKLNLKQVLFKEWERIL